MEKINWTDGAKNEEVLHRVREKVTSYVRQNKERPIF